MVKQFIEKKNVHNERCSHCNRILMGGLSYWDFEGINLCSMCLHKVTGLPPYHPEAALHEKTMPNSWEEEKKKERTLPIKRPIFDWFAETLANE